jgi:hypothetical protein
MKKFFKRIFQLIAENLSLGEIRRQLEAEREAAISDYLQRHLFGGEKYALSKKLNRYERQVYSQGGEDGILQEIFRRIGQTNNFFVEFGAGAGLENNTIFLLARGWNGCWLEGSGRNIKSLEKTFGFLVDQKRLKIKKALVAAENVEQLFGDLAVPTEPDLLSIDIDGNDYWVWRAIKNYHPRVVAIEYNSLWPPDFSWVMKYNPSNRWQGDSYFGASLKSLEELGRQKGYKLVGCSFAGTNAFFVRDDLVANHFQEPFTAANHYEPKRKFLLRRPLGDKRSFGEFENI